MDVHTPWRRKRPVEDEEYLASKKYISEKFFNMRISHPDMPGVRGVRSIWQGAAGKTAAELEGNTMSDEDSLPVEVESSTMSDEGSPTAGSFLHGKAGFMSYVPAEGDVDVAEGPTARRAAMASEAGGAPIPHPFLRTASSTVDEKVDDWVRTSRHRMLADASVNSAPDLCRALILYKPVAPLLPSSLSSLGYAPAEGGGVEPSLADGEDAGGEGGGDPTPSPQAGGDGGGETAPSTAPAAGLRSMVARGRERNIAQSAGSSTAEDAGYNGGGQRTTSQSQGRTTHDFADVNPNPIDHRGGVAGSLFGLPPRGLCTSQSGGDDAGGRMAPRGGNNTAVFVAGDGNGSAVAAVRGDGNVQRMSTPFPASVDEMDMDAAGDEGAGGSCGASGAESEPPELPLLTRVGTSRGAPTPGLTAQMASWARTANERTIQGHSQDAGEIAGGSNAGPPVAAQSWAPW